ncbi:MAG: alpha-hydroxy-acid oxidizing protein [Lachnospiraceae bacterium]|nr:alpha-hydroxy-acid oxidizing protein [Lachnospiraceae bacterium]
MEQRNPGNSDRITREYLDSLLLEMRHIDNKKPDASFKLYGESFQTPIMMAALSHLNNVHEDGMVEMAKGAKMAGAVNWAGMGDMEELERITATGAKTIKIIKPYEDNDMIFERIEHAEKCGVLAVGIDVDHAFNGAGEYDNVLGYSMRPKTMEEIRTFAESTKLPFVIKGVLSERDAYKCLQAGVRGIVVSHHHGIMDYAVPPLMVLPSICKVIGGQIPVFVDCMIMSGMDAFKALALGATAVSAGRVIMGPLGEKGAEGVCEAVNRMTAELKGTMARCGYADVAHIDASVIWKP